MHKPGKRSYLRFSLRTLLCVPLIVGALWWWSTWPERTAERFVRALTDGDVRTAQEMLKLPQSHQSAPASGEVDMWKAAEQREMRYDLPTMHPRSFRDWFLARGDFSFHADSPTMRIHFGTLTAERGSIQPTERVPGQSFLVVYRTRYISTDVAFQRIMKDFTPDSWVMIIANQEVAGVILMASSEGHEEFEKFLQRIDQKTEPRNFTRP